MPGLELQSQVCHPSHARAAHRRIIRVRSARRPQENFNIGRAFRFKERYTLSVRAEFTNIFNRTQIGNPITTAPQTAATKNAAGQYNAGFGVINLTVSGPNQAPSYTQNGVVGALYQLPRNGTLIARFSF